MILTLDRHTLANSATLGDLYLDGVFECHTLEDVVRKGAKVYGETAIPAGTYRVVINLSPRFKKMMMRLLDVPGFDGILIHKGNTDHDTKGCILVGDTLTATGILAGTSTPAYDRLYSKVLNALLASYPVSITIRNTFEGGV